MQYTSLRERPQEGQRQEKKGHKIPKLSEGTIHTDCQNPPPSGIEKKQLSPQSLQNKNIALLTISDV